MSHEKLEDKEMVDILQHVFTQVGPAYILFVLAILAREMSIGKSVSEKETMVNLAALLAECESACTAVLRESNARHRATIEN